jgi:hypothetical protein
MFLQLGFVIFWQKDFGTKAAHKMLVKLTLGGKNWKLISTQKITKVWLVAEWINSLWLLNGLIHLSLQDKMSHFSNTTFSFFNRMLIYRSI